MNDRRNFLKASAASLVGVSLLQHQRVFGFNEQKKKAFVRQLEQTETVIIREHTPITIAISKKQDNAELSICFEELLPSAVIPIHKHLHTDEFFYFFSGNGLVVIDDEEISFKAGTVAFVPRDTWHGIRNTGTEKTFFSFSYSPAGFEDYFRQIGTPLGQPFQQKTKEELAAIAAKYGMVYK